MMKKKYLVPILLMMLSFSACLKDPDPITQNINTYHYYYNYLLESYGLQWEIDELIIGTGHEYGIPAETLFELAETGQEVLIRSRNAENDLLLDSLSYTMFENGAYMIALMGTQEDPHLICEDMDTRIPSAGRVKFRFLHASETLGPVDIYIGGDQAESLALADVDFTQVSEYLEATQEQMWNSIIVAPSNSLPADSTILEYTTNTIFQSGSIYLCVLAHVSSSSDSPFQIQVDYQPVF
jgi:hypothetical protein